MFCVTPYGSERDIMMAEQSFLELQVFKKSFGDSTVF
jgi:hypothetical protein